MPDTIAHHRGVLPHHQEAGQIISLTWRLAFTLPAELNTLLAELHDLVRRLSSEPRPSDEFTGVTHRYTALMLAYDDYLGKHKLDGLNLCQPPQAGIISSSIGFYAGSLYELHAWCLMPNHLHLLLKPLPGRDQNYPRLQDIVRRIKSYTAKEINSAVGGSGPLWQHEYFDRYIRDNADYYRTVNYYRQNPVKAGLAKKPEDWPHSFYQPGMIE